MAIPEQNFGLWSGCWQAKATDLAPPRDMDLLGHPAWRPSLTRRWIRTTVPARSTKRARRERGQFLEEAMEPIQRHWHRHHHKEHEQEPRLVAECLGLRTTAFTR